MSRIINFIKKIFIHLLYSNTLTIEFNYESKKELEEIKELLKYKKIKIDDIEFGNLGAFVRKGKLSYIFYAINEKQFKDWVRKEWNSLQ